jgi:hypothetical protein
MNEPEPEKGRLRTFWTSLPGILTATAALLGAIVAVLALSNAPGDSGDGGGSSRPGGTTERGTR